MTRWLRRQGYVINRKRVQRLMRTMGLESIAPSPRTTVPGSGHRIYPYLLKNLEITKPNQVWGADITYVPLAYGFLYLVAILDWYSRYVVSWRLSNSLDERFCLEALEEALTVAQPEIRRGRDFDQHGWQRSGFGQRVRGAVMAHGEVRRDLSQGLRGAGRM